MTPDHSFGDGVTVRGARLAEYTTFRLGGPCPRLIDCPTQACFASVWRTLLNDPEEPAPVLIGGGSNLLVLDEGVKTTVVRYVEATPSMERAGHTVSVSAGTLLDDLARITAEWGLDGVVMCSGIPGTVGGAIAGNAGAFGEQIGDRVVSLQVIDCHGQLRERTPAELGFSYRRSRLSALGDVLLSAGLALEKADAAALRSRRAEILALRAAKHPDWRVTPTAGSFFKNIEPTSTAERRQAAGWFLEQAGALAMRVGGARPFARHANIIVAEPGCRASDVVELSRQMALAVREKFGLDLEREVKMIG